MTISIIGLILGVFGLLGLLGSAFAILKASAKTASVNLWREEATAQKARADRLEIALGEIDARVKVLEVENKRLAELASSRSAIESLGLILHGNHIETMQRIDSLVMAQGAHTDGHHNG
jgi:hypothetical protein